jgi:hypothetical protein
LARHPHQRQSPGILLKTIDRAIRQIAGICPPLDSGVHTLISRLVCTIITKRYLAHARVLAESIHRHDPGLPVLVLLADRPDGHLDPAMEPFQLVQLEELPDQEAIQSMSFYYTPFEFCNALRPLFHDYILTHTTAKSWIYLDSDILVLGNLDDIFKQIENSSIVLSPHITQPSHPLDIEVVEFTILHAGIYNSGFLGLHRTEDTRAFIAWFKERLRWFCFEDHKNGFVDQAWLNYVPLFFNGVSLLHNPGANLGHWRLRGLTISRRGDRVFADGDPVIFIHFSGWSPEIPKRISVYNCGLNSETCPGWEDLSAYNASRLRDCGWEAVKKLPYAFDAFADGHRIRLRYRQYFYFAARTGRLTGTSPFISRQTFLISTKAGQPFWKALAFSIIEFLLGCGPGLPTLAEKRLSRLITGRLLNSSRDA